jgi:hypothetical protein
MGETGCMVNHCKVVKEMGTTIVKHELRIRELIDAMNWFCERVEKGEVRSTKTYNRFKELISKQEN